LEIGLMNQVTMLSAALSTKRDENAVFGMNWTISNPEQ
jgi:hypothetical protein